MKNIKSTVIKALGLFIVFTIICGVIYPGAITIVAQTFMPEQANSSIIEVDGKKYGSALLAQQFTSNDYLWGRVMNVDTDSFVDENGKKQMYASASNISPASDEYKSLIKERVDKIKAAHPDQLGKVPSDLVTVSGSGLDPEISLKAAKYQVSRIAKERNMSKREVNEIIDEYTNHKFLGFLGEETVNVLKVNLALEGILK